MAGYDQNPPMELGSLRGVPLSSLKMKPDTVQCPACQRCAYTEVVDKETKTPKAMRKFGLLVLVTCCTGLFILPCLCCIAYGDTFQGATHFCPNCGIRLAFWNGSNFVFATSDNLTDVAPMPRAAWGDAEANERIAISPLGPRPALNSKMYSARPAIQGQMLSALLKLDGQTQFPTAIQFTGSEVPPYTIQEVSFSKEDHYNEYAFHPHNLDGAGSTDRAAVLQIYRERRREGSVGEIRFHNSSWDMQVFFTVGQYSHQNGNRPLEVGFPTPEYLDGRLYVPILTSCGPLVWTDPKESDAGLSRMVLFDAYERAVAIWHKSEDQIDIYNGTTSPTFVDEVVLTFLAVTIQRTRRKQHKTAVMLKRQND